MRLLIVGHGCNPYTSSEPGLTWNWSWYMAAEHIVHLIAHPQSRGDVDAFLSKTPRPNLHIHWVDVDSPIDQWDPAAGEKGIQFHYMLWLRRASKLARELHRRHGFDIVHHVGWATVSVPSPFWKLGCPLVWGPLGGGQFSPRPLMGVYKTRQWKEAVRTMRVKFLPLYPAFRRSVQKASRVLATNRETRALLRAGGAAHVDLMFDNALRSEFLPAQLPVRERREELRILWVGKLIRWKGLDLALRALAVLGPASRTSMSVVGAGPVRNEFEETARSVGLGDRVDFKGRVDWSRMPGEFTAADVLLFTSLRDSSGSVVLEAMAYGLPVITLDHGGIGTFLPADAGLKVEVSDMNATIGRIAAAIQYLRDHAEERHRMGCAASTYAQENTWEKRVAAMQHVYDEVRSVAPVRH